MCFHDPTRRALGVTKRAIIKIKKIGRSKLCLFYYLVEVKRILPFKLLRVRDRSRSKICQRDFTTLVGEISYAFHDLGFNASAPFPSNSESFLLKLSRDLKDRRWMMYRANGSNR